jgi:hypothetical protein
MREASISAAKVTALQAPGQVLLKLAAAGFGLQAGGLEAPRYRSDKFNASARTVAWRRAAGH